MVPAVRDNGPERGGRRCPGGPGTPVTLCRDWRHLCPDAVRSDAACGEVLARKTLGHVSEGIWCSRYRGSCQKRRPNADMHHAAFWVGVMRSFWDRLLMLVPRASTSCAIYRGAQLKLEVVANEASIESRCGGNRNRADVWRMRYGGCRGRWPAGWGDAGRVP